MLDPSSKLLILIFFFACFSLGLTDDIQKLTERSVDLLPDGNPSWGMTITADGKWNDVNYTSGCNAPRASWTATSHWQRIAQMAKAWSVSSTDSNLLSKIRLGMNWWFSRDYNNENCAQRGGTPKCPCGTPGMWNTNWYNQIIAVPSLAGPTCVILKSRGVNLTDLERTKCQLFMSRSYKVVDKWTGANLLDISRIGLYMGVFNKDINTIKGSFGNAFSGLVYTGGIKDGIKVDGSFFQHDRILYNGNYGQDLARDSLFFLQMAAGIDQFAPSEGIKSAVSSYLLSSEWMLFYDSKNNVWTWDPSVRGRYFAGTRILGLSLPAILNSTSEWKQSKEIRNMVKRLSTKAAGSNPGNLNGNKMMWRSDYMVHRGTGYVLTLKMYSTRITNTECINSQNLKGIHQSQGVLLSFTGGSEYFNVPPVWDWNLLPGTTVDPGVDPLKCGNTRYMGLHEQVGGVSDGKSGIATMKFTDPLQKALSWTKSWFFFEDCYISISSNVVQKDLKPVVVVLDQRRLNGKVETEAGTMQGEELNTKKTLWMFHDSIGYIFPNASPLQIETKTVTGKWSDVGAGFATGSVTAKMFKATMGVNKTTAIYIGVPGVSLSGFSERREQIQSSVRIISSAPNQVVLHSGKKLYGLVLSETSTTQIGKIKVANQHPIIILVDFSSKDQILIRVADPTQKLKSTTVDLYGSNLSCGDQSNCTSKGNQLSINVILPSGEYAGGTTFITIDGTL
eukprot:TRINITY_DN5489_c0_g3_i1.p1 TRINITY_DN5489_c0_g3~~TRINITY_DN5489_c0_g3_i1.p1  ORF type:complete len:732 (-),score=155.16 TRINITY_DN5489_c0_g3_i1:48-2243(-)